MKIDHLSDGALPQRNDDHVAIFDHAGVTDVLVIDGGSSVAQRDYLDADQGDVAWFVHAFMAALERELAPERDQQTCVRAAIGAVNEQFERLAGSGAQVPLYAWPIAAMTWLRIAAPDPSGIAQATLFGLGDCKSLLSALPGLCVDLDPVHNPQDGVLQAAIAKLRAAGVIDPVARREQMLPMLRARREFQNLEPEPGVLCLRPHGPFSARVRRIDLHPGARLLVMTDGFYRLVDPYGRYADADLVDACVERGLASMLDELRTIETVGGTGARAVKAADDASAVMLVWP